MMKTYVCILRGINVGGHKKILMSDLAAMFEESGYKKVSTYIQSGNVIFHSPEEIPGDLIAGKIRKAIHRKFGFDVPVIVRTINEMQKTVRSNPFLKDREISVEKLHVTLLSEIPEKTLLDALKKHDFPPDKFSVVENDVFLYCPGGYGNTRLSNAFFENRLNVSATTRNWKTIVKLADGF
jgi:uncharacterized protein (DUF1697 family)